MATGRAPVPISMKRIKRTEGDTPKLIAIIIKLNNIKLNIIKLMFTRYHFLNIVFFAAADTFVIVVVTGTPPVCNFSTMQIIIFRVICY